MHCRQTLLDGIENLADHLAPVAARTAHCLGQHAVTQGMQVAERQLLQLAIERIEPEAVGDRRVDLQRLAGDAAALVEAHGIQRAHVVQAVGQLDEDDAHVVRHRQQHLAKILGLRFFVGLVFQPVQLGNAVDQFGGNLAEILRDLRLGDGGVFHHVVQQRGRQRLGVEPPVRQRFGHGERMRNIRIAAGAELATMRVGREMVGRRDLVDVLRFQVGGKLGDEML